MRQVVEDAARRGLAAISITDHDVVGGIAEAREVATEHGIELLSGIELTADWDGRTVHVLGYGIDPENETLLAALDRGRRLMGEHVERVLAAIRESGQELAAADLEKYRSRYVGGASLILGMVERNILRRAKNGAVLLKLASGEPRAYTAVEAIELIHGAGGVASLAHPVKIARGEPLLEASALRPLVDAGLDGLEVWQIVHGRAEREHYASVARELGLAQTGGSDCHGPTRDRGPRIGSQRVPYGVFAAIKDAVDARRAAAP